MSQAIDKTPSWMTLSSDSVVLALSKPVEMNGAVSYTHLTLPTKA